VRKSSQIEATTATTKTKNQNQKMNTQAEYQTAFKIVSDYLKFAEEKSSQGLTVGKLSGNEKHFVQQYLYDLSEQKADSIDHPFRDHWKCLQTKAGKNRVATQLQSIARNLLLTFKDKYPHFYAQVTGSPKLVQPLATIALTKKQKTTVETLLRDGWKINEKHPEGYVTLSTPAQHLASGARVFENGNLHADYYDETKGHRVRKIFYASQFNN
jgi:hypothetical protein